MYRTAAAALVIAACALPAEPARTADGPCGIALGTWTANARTCTTIKAGSNKIGGQDSYMSFGRGGKWAQWESLCDIRRPVRRGDICTMELHCMVEGTPSVGTPSFKILGPDLIAFADDRGAYTERYTRCTAKPFSPYFDLD